MKNCINFFLLVSLFVLNIQTFYAQTIEELKGKLNSSNEDTAKVIFLLNDICPYYLGHGIPKDALSYVEEAEQLAEKLNFVKGQIHAYTVKGDIYGTLGEPDKGLAYLKKALELGKKSSLSQENIAVIHFNIGNMYNRKSNLVPALENYFKTIEILDQCKVKKYPFRATILRNIAVLYKTNKEYDKAILYSNNALNIFLKIQDLLSLAGVYANLGSAYYEKNNCKTALIYYTKGLQISKKVKRISSIITNTTGIGLVHQNLKNYQEALNYHLKSLAIARENKLKGHEANAMCNVGIDYHGLKEYDKAQKYLSDALILAKEVGSIDLQKTIYKFQAKFFEDQKETAKALEALKKKTEFNDSIFNEKNANQLNELSIKFETAKKEKKIAVLHADLLSKKKDQLVLQAKIQKRNSVILGTLLGSVLIIVTTILLFNRRRLLQQNKYQLALNHQRENTTSEIVQAQEKEQSRIAKELHDSVGTFLSTLKINLQLYEEVIPENKKEGYHNATNIIDKISVELRNIMKNLSNETLQDQGLIKGFEELIYRINELEIVRVDFHTTDMKERLNEITEHNLYRIAQELLNNCIKHSKAENATLQLIEDDETISLIFEDDGVGFDVDNPILKHKNHGMGLKNIYNRVNFIKGTIRIESSPKNGSIFIIEVPKKVSLNLG